jgi:mannan endo-1,4-beta-mannosidase
MFATFARRRRARLPAVALSLGTAVLVGTSLIPLENASAHSVTVLAATTAQTTGAYESAVLSDNPAAYWPLGEAGGSTSVGDATGHGHTGTLQGGVTLSVAGVLSGDTAAAFDGSSGRISIGNTAGLPSGASAYSLEAWIKLNAATDQGILGLGDYSSNKGSNALRTVGSTGLLNYWWGDDISRSTTDLRAAWHYVVATFDGTTRRLYLDAAQVAQDQPGMPAVVLSNVRLGQTCCNEYFNGTLDEVAMYSTALTPTRIQAHYTARSQTTATPTPSQTSSNTPLPTNTPAPATGSANFLGTRGTNFVVNGSLFRFVGANLYNAAGDPTIYECGPWMSNPSSELNNWFAHARSDYGASVIRFWAFQSYAAGGTNWQAFDRVISLAKQNGLRVIPVLENEWSDCTQGGYKYNTWYAGGYLQPYGTYSLSYRDYVARVVQRYRNEPTVAAWMLMNEAESQSSSGIEDSNALYTFARDVSGYVKSLDPNHLVTLGVMGGGQPGVEGANYQRLHGLPTIDFAEYHDYGADDQSMPGAPLPAPTVPLATGVYTQDKYWQWAGPPLQTNFGRAWQTFSWTIPSGATPFQRIGLNIVGTFSGDLYIGPISIGSRTYSFSNGTTQGWQLQSAGTLNVVSSGPNGAPALKLSVSSPTTGIQLWVQAALTDAPGVPINANVYVDASGSVQADNSLAADLFKSQQLAKPLLVGESGMTTCASSAGSILESASSRAQKFDAKMTSFFAGGGGGYLVWAWNPSNDCSYDFTVGDPLNAVLMKHSSGT